MLPGTWDFVAKLARMLLAPRLLGFPWPLRASDDKKVHVGKKTLDFLIGGSAVLHALGAPTPAFLADGAPRAGILAYLRVHVGMVLSPSGGHRFFGYSKAHAIPPTPGGLWIF